MVNRDWIKISKGKIIFNSFELFIKNRSLLTNIYIYKAIFNDVYNYASNDYSKNNILIMYIIIRMMVWYYVRRIT